jgi:alkanesulfonate monooxygenase SsuD/methylene tetrahydromethanopterin reductase-like flavin-dependent oxidoreductase (luciferase family)
VKLDGFLLGEPEAAAANASRLEQLGYDGIWTSETRHDPFLPLALASAATTRVTLGTAIATAFTRSPWVTAVTAWDLQRLSGGRFVLGLGTQVRAHNERRFSVPFEAPGAKLRELVEALRHIWGAFQGEHRLRFRGRFYRHDLVTPFFDPGPLDAGPRLPRCGDAGHVPDRRRGRGRHSRAPVPHGTLPAGGRGACGEAAAAAGGVRVLCCGR